MRSSLRQIMRFYANSQTRNSSLYPISFVFNPQQKGMIIMGHSISCRRVSRSTWHRPRCISCCGSLTQTPFGSGRQPRAGLPCAFFHVKIMCWLMNGLNIISKHTSHVNLPLGNPYFFRMNKFQNHLRPVGSKMALWKPNVERHVLPMSVVRTAAPFQQIQLLHACASCPNTSSLKCSFKIFQGRSTSRVLWLANAANWCKTIIREIETILTFRWSGVKETFISLSLFPLVP